MFQKDTPPPKKKINSLIWTKNCIWSLLDRQINEAFYQKLLNIDLIEVSEHAMWTLGNENSRHREQQIKDPETPVYFMSQTLQGQCASCGE